MKESKSDLQSYFTTEVNEKMSSMTSSTMTELLRDLENTPYWTAILKYYQERSDVARNGLYSLDPIKEPAQICRLQGMINGFYDLIDAVIRIKETSNQKNRAKREDEE